VAGGAWAVFGPGTDNAPKQTAIEPAEETSATTVPPVPGAESTAAPSAEGTSGGQAAGELQTPSTSGPTKVAFRLGNSLYVANDDGTEAISVADAARSYILSPDERTLAIVYGEGENGTRGTVTFVDTATGLSRRGGKGAAPLVPSWAPDSSWLAFSALRTDGAFELKGVGSDGKGDTTIVVPGALPKISVATVRIAFKQTDQAGLDDPLMTLVPGAKKSRALKGSEGALSWSWGAGDVLYFTKAGAGEGQWELWAAPHGSDAEKIGATALPTPAHALGRVIVSPNGKKIVMSAIGDDDYSRLMVFDVAASRFFSVSTRRDAYPASWAGDSRILYFEGNSYQGEASALMSIESDGTGRRMVVSGAQP